MACSAEAAVESSFKMLKAGCCSLLPVPCESSCKKFITIVEDVPVSHLQQMSNYALFPFQLTLKRYQAAKLEDGLPQGPMTMRECDFIAFLSCLDVLLTKLQLTRWDAYADLFSSLCCLLVRPSQATDLDPNLSEDLLLKIYACLRTLAATREAPILARVFGPKFLPILGHAVFLTLKVLESHRHVQLRVACCGFLGDLAGVNWLHSAGANDGLTLDEPSTRHETFKKFLPKVSIQLTQLVTEGPVLHHSVVVAALKTWTGVVCLALWRPPEDHTDDDDASSVEISEKLKIMINRISSDLSTHSHKAVRSTMIIWAKSLLDQDKKLANCQSILLDTLVGLIHDPEPGVSSTATSVSKECMSRLHLKLHAIETLHRLCDSLPTQIRSDLDSGATLRRLAGYSQLLEAELRVICLSRSDLLRGFLIGMCQCIEFDPKRVPLVSELGGNVVETDFLDSNSPVYTPAVPLKFMDSGVFAVFAGCMAQWAKSGDISTIVTSLIDIGHDLSHLRNASLVLCNLILKGLASDQQKLSEIVPFILDNVLQILGSTDTDSTPSDSSVECCEPLKIGPDTIACTLCLDAFALACLAMRKRIEARLLDMLAPTLQCYASKQSAVSDTAARTLACMAKSVNLCTRSALILEYADYLLHSINMQLRYFTVYPKAPLLLVAIIDFFTPELLPRLEPVLREMLAALDANYVDACAAFLVALDKLLAVILANLAQLEERYREAEGKNLAKLEEKFRESEREKDVLAVGDPEMELEPGCDDVKKPALPLHAQVASDVLHRCKHLVSAHHAHLRLISLSILRTGLRILATHEDAVLPLIHQSWPGVKARFAPGLEPELGVTQAAVRVVFTMGTVSRDFIYRRFFDDIWPKMKRFLTLQSEKSARTGAFYRQSQACKLQTEILAGLADFLEQIKLAEDDFGEIVDGTFGYLSLEQPERFQDFVVDLYRSFRLRFQDRFETELTRHMGFVTNENRCLYSVNFDKILK